MNKDYLENKGWKFSSEFDDILSFEKGDVWKDCGMGAFLNFNTKNYNLRIKTTNKGFDMDGPKTSTKFDGYCGDHETFELICKLIKLKI